MEKQDLSVAVNKALQSGSVSPGKKHTIYFQHGPLDLSKQSVPGDPGDAMSVPMFKPSVVASANGTTLSQQVAIARYSRLGYYETPTEVIHVMIMTGVGEA